MNGRQLPGIVANDGVGGDSEALNGARWGGGETADARWSEQLSRQVCVGTVVSVNRAMATRVHTDSWLGLVDNRYAVSLEQRLRLVEAGLSELQQVGVRGRRC